MFGNLNIKTLAGIQYHGLAGVSSSCKEAIIRLLQNGDDIVKAELLSNSNQHCFLLSVNCGELIAIKSGFSSGYPGEGPRALSTTLQVLKLHNVEIEEYQVSEDFLYRIDQSCLTFQDIEEIENAQPVRPWRWQDYIYDQHGLSSPTKTSTLRSEFPFVIPHAIVDHRLKDLSLELPNQPDNAILLGFRRLEDILRERLKIDEHGIKLFNDAFMGEQSILYWKDIQIAEQKGRAQLFVGAFMGYRNRRAHREISSNPSEAIHEFMLLNHLYMLENTAVERNNIKKI